MKFALGDRVQYQTKSPKYDFEGVVIGDNYDGYLVLPDTPQVSKGFISFHDHWLEKDKALSVYFIPTGSGGWADNFVKPVAPAAWISKRSKALQPATEQYIPTQEGDRDTDI